jgi:outer membrane protein OmpA-like peptidoglycan-associated protein
VPTTAGQNQSFNTAMYGQLVGEAPVKSRGKYVTGILAVLAAITGGLWMFTGGDEAPQAEIPAETATADVAELAPILPSNVTAHFGFDSSALDASTRAQLAELAGGLKSDIDVKVSIAGHADERGSEQYNMKLGMRRAQAAKAFLVEQGVAAERLSTVSHGEGKPIASGSDESSWAKNRRVEVTVGSQLISQR